MVVYVTQRLVTKGDVDYAYIKRRYSVGPMSQTDILYHRPITQKEKFSKKDITSSRICTLYLTRCHNSLNRNAKLLQIFVVRNILVNGLADQLLRLGTVLF